MSLYVDIEKDLGGFRLQAKFAVDGGVTGLLGASGAGKSMTLRCIAGIERPDRGRIVLDGVTLFDAEKRIDLPPQRRQVGYLFQSYALYPHMTVRQNILCALRGVKDKAERAARLANALRTFRLEEVADHKPAALSGGQAQRVAVARALANRPRLLLLDEPFSALDAHLRLRLQLALKETLDAYDGGVLLVTHSRDEAYRMCDALTVVEDGAFSPVRATKALFADPGSFAAARLTGCKNLSRAVKIGEYEIEAPEWGVRLTTAQPVREGLCGVGIRAHHFHPRAAQNSFPVRFAGELEEPFEQIMLFRCAGQAEDAAPIWWRLPKDRKPRAFPERLGVAPENVLLLYE